MQRSETDLFPFVVRNWCICLFHSSFCLPEQGHSGTLARLLLGQSYFRIKTKPEQLASESSCVTKTIPDVPDVWKYASAPSTGGETQTAFSKVECWKKITTSVNFLKILAFELPGIPQEMWVSSSKPANLVNWYCRNQQRVWLAHKTTGEINCRDCLAMRSVRAWE